MNKTLSLLLASSTLFLAQCASELKNSTSSSKSPAPIKYETEIKPDGSFRKNGYWVGDSLTGTPGIRISLDEQLAYFYKGQQLAGISPISTGKSGYETPIGNFAISQKSKNHKSSLYGVIVNTSTNELVNDDADSRIDKPGRGEKYIGAPMPNFMRFNGPVGMHTGQTPGYPASHGCVRLPDHMANKFFSNTRVGTKVIVNY